MLGGLRFHLTLFNPSCCKATQTQETGRQGRPAGGFARQTTAYTQEQVASKTDVLQVAAAFMRAELGVTSVYKVGEPLLMGCII